MTDEEYNGLVAIEALEEIRRAIGCPEWVNADETANMVTDLSNTIARIAGLMCLTIAPSTEQFRVCTTLVHCENIEEHLLLQLSEELGECDEIAVVPGKPTLQVIQGGA